MSYDVAVVGAGPAGAATAGHLAMRGWRVLLLDKATFPRDKICGEALSPGALPVLGRLGALPAVEAAASPIGGARIRTAAFTCEGRYPDVPGLPSRGLAVPRLVLDPLLLALAANRPGVTVETGVAVRGLTFAGGRCTGLETSAGHVAARAVVLAEGRTGQLHPAMRRSKAPRRRMAFVATFDGVEGLTDMLELDLRSATIQTVLSPQGNGRAALCVVSTGGPAAPLGAPPLEGLVRILREDPILAERLAAAQPVSALKGMPLDPYWGDPAPMAGLVAVGDSLCHFDPITGEGMYRALRSAELAADALDEALQRDMPRLAAYAEDVTREFCWTYRFVDAVVALTRHPGLAQLAVRGLAARPALADRMIGYQGAMLPAERFFPDMLRVAVAAI
ncbi:MAG: monooxygenase FAD-binding [Cyanobacteria bacterium RYN_339]|nr:monooxygenase FAD-binding [Cyanobacteria bacterium RYN_339]